MATTDQAIDQTRNASASALATPGGRGTIVVRGLSKHFRVPHDRPNTIKERVLHPLRRSHSTEVRAVDDVSVEVAPGEFFGIIGPNGSGKSTLLKLLAGILRPDAGELQVAGRVSPLIELGVGFNPELAARDNVILNSTLLGLSRAEAARRFDRIVEFAGLEEFVDMKLKNYSSGMQVRLAFATAIQVDPDILLLDEVLAVGDVAFQEKCFDVFRRMHNEGCTIVLVTHGLEIVRRFCDRAMLLENGAAIALGDPGEVVDRYLASAFGERGEQDQPQWVKARRGDGSARVLEAWFEDGAGERIDSTEAGDTLVLRVTIEFHSEMPSPSFGVVIVNERNETVFVASTIWSPDATPDFTQGQRGELRLALTNHFGVGRLWVMVSVSSSDGVRLADFRGGVASILVNGPHWTGGAADLPHEISVEHL